MFASCLHCSNALGHNTQIDAFPVGRQLAFDAANGRLWVVCAACGRWNLTPLEERWEAIEQCERLFRATPLRASTGQIGLAQLPDRMQLVRIGAPDRPEFAAWRYGRVFAARRRKAFVLAGAVAATAVGAWAFRTLNPSAFGAMSIGALLPQMGNYIALYRLTLKPIATITAPDGTARVLRGRDIGQLRLESGSDASGWQLRVMGRSAHDEAITLQGGAAERVLTRALAAANQTGGGSSAVESAVALLADAGSPAAFVRGYLQRTGGAIADPMWSRMTPEWLALEMALHEDAERVAMSGALAALEASWREAEEIAAIADGLLLPRFITDRLQGFAS